MKTVVITGGIGSGKSYVAELFAKRGIPVYDSDSRAKMLYAEVPGLMDKVEDAFGTRDLRKVASVVFEDKAKLAELESLVHPEVYADFERWKERQKNAPFALFESAIILDRKYPENFADAFIYVDAPLETRISRAMKRDSASREHIMDVISSQNMSPDDNRIDYIIDNNSSFSMEDLEKQIDKILKDMKTNLSKTLSVTGHGGLYTYLAQSRSGVIVESLEDKKRSQFSLSSKMTSLEDISIYTDEGEIKLREVFTKIGEYLKGAKAPSSKSDPAILKDLFENVLPTYDRDRFYVSHMKKVVDWYNCLVEYASLDFVNPEEESQAE